ncbi:MAG: F0F1 ATP synthase subunit B [Flavobacteriales bacterium]|nr:F0F1 ATP synthase subunit B [Flavobacteriales bacterium]
MDLITPALGLVVWTVIPFILLMLLLKKYAWKPILAAVKDREKSINDALDSAEKAKVEMAQLQADNEKILKEARAERDIIMKEARDMKDKMINEAKSEAAIEADKLIVIAKKSIEHETMSAMTELKNQIADLSIGIAEKILRNELENKDAQMELVEKLVQEAEDNMGNN